MAGKPISGDGLPANLAGMTKNQLYDIMSQMKTLIEQNKQQAREILIQNPPLTKALFQAQIMLGMLQPPQVIPNIQPAASSQQPQQSAQPQPQPQPQPLPPQQSNIHATHSLPLQVGLQDQTGASLAQSTMRRQPQNLSSLPTASAGPPINIQSQPMPSHPLQIPQHSKGNLNPQAAPMTIPQPSQLPNMSSPPVLSSSQPIPHHQNQMPAVSAQLQQPVQTSAISHLPLQPPLPQQQRLHSMPSYHHQYGQQMGFQHTGAPQHPSQPAFHSGNKNQPSMGSSFQQGQPPLHSQPPQSLYQTGGSNLGSEFSNQMGSSMQADRGSPWMSSPPDGSSMAQLPGAAPLAPSQMGASSQPGRSAALTPDMEKALLQQVMSLTPEQINLLPPEQRNQVLQLQQMLRQ